MNTYSDLAGRRVARVGFGAMQLPGRDRDTAIAVLRRAVESGVNHIDTAHFYGPGEANALIREALSPYPDDLVLVSKVGAEHAPQTEIGLVLAQRPEQLRAGVEANLAQLGVERIPVINLRRTDIQPGVVAEGDQVVGLDDQLAELAALRDEGKIGAIGLSAVSAEKLKQALPVGIACVQNAHSVLDRGSEPVLDLCREHDIPWVPFFPLGSAFPGAPKVTDNPAVKRIADESGATPAQIGLAWELAHYENALLIPGTADPDHLAENIAAADVELTPQAKSELDVLAA
ncbi:aldo/keto reductase [Saccharopolyspora sp. TS4A08]|uniref:Aldo/keto reductase n=1 Tax=Saccharopolyspora ipomoeae TaxID=3042027 RepID=A0ABT6PPF3_9PSEU|nr:aldo/keto reductase [Saccharopolyspora sp. TS4A08]MDI2029899.1 aldo/keto reductase [Saccharopolyspora sp. TS4A08]